MGSSYTEYRGRGFWTRDGRLEIWLYQLVLTIDSRPDRPAWLRPARDHWELEATVGFVGCIDPDLDGILGTDADRVAALADLCEQALRAVRDAGVIRRDAMASAGVGGPGTVWLGDVAAGPILTVGRAFVDLLTDRSGEDATTSPML